MKLSRETQIKIKFILEQLIPPLLRDTKFFNTLPFKILFKDKAPIFFQFKNKASKLSEKEYQDIYKQVDSVIFTKETDLNAKCLDKIIQSIKGQDVLEVGCGKGYLAKKLSQKFKVTASDIYLDPHFPQVPNLKFKQANIENLPFKNQGFDTVICTHTLEHVQNLFQAISELRRVTKKRLIVVVPKERPYKYTFNLHLHFFPYPHSFLTIMGTNKKNSCHDVGGDLFYIEDF